MYELNVKHSFVQCYSAEYVTDRDVLTEQGREGVKRAQGMY